MHGAVLERIYPRSFHVPLVGVPPLDTHDADRDRDFNFNRASTPTSRIDGSQQPALHFACTPVPGVSVTLFERLAEREPVPRVPSLHRPVRALSEPQRALTRSSPSPSSIEFGTTRNSTRTHPFCVLIASLSRLERRTRLCQSTSQALAEYNFATCAFGLKCVPHLPDHGRIPLELEFRFVGRGLTTDPQSILRRSTGPANGRPIPKPLGHIGNTTVRIPGFEYNLFRLGTRTRRGRGHQVSHRTTDSWYLLQPTGVTTQYWDHSNDNCLNTPSTYQYDIIGV